MNRRAFLAAATSAAACGISGCMSSARVLQPDVSVYMTDKLYNNINDNHSGGNAEEYGILVRDFIDDRLSVLSTSDTDVSPDVTLGSLNVNQDKIKNAETEDPLGYWDDKIESLVPKEEISKHSNILLTAGMPHPKKGYGEYPNCCGTDIPTSMVYSTNASFEHMNDIIGFYHPGYSRMVALHEVSHNLGLKHNMGYLTDQGDEDEMVVTPMMAGYVDEFQGDDNYFGRKIPTVPDSKTVRYSTYLNPDIEPNLINLHNHR